MKKYTAFSIVFYLFFVNCNQVEKKVENGNIKEIDIKANLSNNRTIKLSEIASSIEYCVLETDEKYLIADPIINCSKDYVVTLENNMSNTACYVFGRKSGNFVRQISSYGQGPGEYTEAIRSFWDGKKEQVCLWGNNQYLFYNLDGTLSHKANRFNHYMDHFVAYEDLYVGYVPNKFGNATIRIAFYDKTGVLIGSIPNHRSWKRTQTWWGSSTDSWLYVFRNDLYYKDIYCDTLYQINDFTLQPRYIFNTGGLTVPYEIQEGGRHDFLASLSNGGIVIDRYEKYVNILKVFESNRYLFFTVENRQLLYPAIYDKNEDKFQIMSSVSIPPKKGRDWKIPLHGFENDFDGGLPFWPQQMISDKEMMCVYAVEDLLALDTTKITDVKLKNVLNCIDEYSNPVIAIVTLKD